MASLFRKLTLLLLWLAPRFSQAQEVEYPDGVFSFEPGSSQKVFVDFAKVRTQPNVQAPVLDSLRSNQAVTIVEKDATILKIGERRAVWYRIQYSGNGGPATGYLWGGNLCIGFRKKDSWDVLFGIGKTMSKSIPEEKRPVPQNMGSVKLMQDTMLLEEAAFEMPSGESLSAGSFSLESAHRLPNVAYTIKASVSGEACGIPGYEQYVLVTTDRKLILLPQLMGLGDAGVFYHAETFVFPNDKGGQPGTIVLKTEEGETNERTGTENVKRSRVVYTWDGKTLFRKGK